MPSSDFGLGVGPGGGAGYTFAPIRGFTTASGAASTTLTGSDRTVLVTATAAAGSVVLPSASKSKGRIYTVKKVDASANAVTITDVSGANVESGASLALSAQYATANLQSDGTQWWEIGKV